METSGEWMRPEYIARAGGGHTQAPVPVAASNARMDVLEFSALFRRKAGQRVPSGGPST
jgi:hypothetical protein